MYLVQNTFGFQVFQRARGPRTWMARDPSPASNCRYPEHSLRGVSPARRQPRLRWPKGVVRQESPLSRGSDGSITRCDFREQSIYINCLGFHRLRKDGSKQRLTESAALCGEQAADIPPLATSKKQSHVYCNYVFHSQRRYTAQIDTNNYNIHINNTEKEESNLTTENIIR